MDSNKIIITIKSWILDYVNKMERPAKSLVIGISGGIDSSVTSTICAMTGLRTIVLSMPIEQIKSQYDLSIKHLNWLKSKFKNVEGHVINLDRVFKSFEQTLSEFLITSLRSHL